MKMKRKMTDEIFFTQHVDTTIPGLETIPELCKNGQYDEARRVFADVVRRRAEPERFLSIPYEIGENIIRIDGEDEMAMADRVCRKIILSCGVPMDYSNGYDWTANPTYNQYNEWTWQLNRHNEFKCLGYAYQKTGDEKYANCFLEMFESWVQQMEVPPEETEYGETYAWRTIETGIRMVATWPYAFFAFFKSPIMTDDFIVEWYKSVWEHGRRLFLQNSTCNWLIMEMGGLSVLGMLFRELKDADAWSRYAIERLRQELYNQVYADGWQFELTTNYQETCINNYFRVIRVANAYGVELPDEFRTIIERETEIFVKYAMPDGSLPNINDGAYERAAEYLCKKLDYFPERKDFLWVATDGREGEVPAIGTVALPNAGQMVFRSGWERDAVYAHFDAGPLGAGHQHEDKLSLMVYANGHLAVPEGATYAYDGSPMRQYVSHTRAHNTVMINGQGQCRWPRYEWHEGDIDAPSGMEYRLGDDVDYATARYDEGYGPDYYPATHTRGVAFMKNAGHGLKPFFLVFDRVEADEEVRFESLWHLDDETFSMCNLSARTSHVTVMADGEGLALSAVRGQEYPVWQGFMATAFAQGCYKPVYTLRYTGKAKSTAFVTLIYPQGEGCPVTGVRLCAPGEACLTLKNGETLTVREADFQ